MLTIDRHDKIIELLRTEKTCKVESLARALYVSAATIRRDLAELEKAGLVRRAHGGAALSGGGESSLLIRLERESAAKRKIAELALPLLNDARTVFIDSSSTLSVFAGLIRMPHRTFITTGLRTAMILADHPSIEIIVPSGKVHYLSNSVEGGLTTRELGGYNIDLAMFSAAGVGTDGSVTDNTVEQCAIKRAVMSRAARTALLVDHTKFGHPSLCEICRLTDFDNIVTDAPLSPDLTAACGDAGLLIAQ